MCKKVKAKNLKRAMAILTTEPDDYDIATGGRNVYVAGQKLSVENADDCEVLAVLMSNKEFGFAAGCFEDVTAKMRKLQQVWLDAANEMKKG